MGNLPRENHPKLIVGYDLADDAGVFLLDDHTALIQTVDFFTPIVDDPYTFGQVAAANALSDVYAMGGRPITALNIVGFPIKTMDKQILVQVLSGGMDKVHESGAAVAGGHSVDDLEIKYGLAVTGLVHPQKIMTNSGARPGQVLVLTKPLGTGIVSTAIKGRQATDEQERAMIDSMLRLNTPGAMAAEEFGVRGGTDITGFGLLGHALEMARASQVGFVIEAGRIPRLPGALEFAAMGLVPGGSWANQNFCSASFSVAQDVAPELLSVLADAQTSGGLLLAVDPDKAEELVARARKQNAPDTAIIGWVTEKDPGRIMVEK